MFCVVIHAGVYICIIMTLKRRILFCFIVKKNILKQPMHCFQHFETIVAMFSQVLDNVCHGFIFSLFNIFMSMVMRSENGWIVYFNVHRSRYKQSNRNIQKHTTTPSQKHTHTYPNDRQNAHKDTQTTQKHTHSHKSIHKSHKTRKPIQHTFKYAKQVNTFKYAKQVNTFKRNNKHIIHPPSELNWSLICSKALNV